MRKFGKDGKDVDAAIEFLFGVYDENGIIINMKNVMSDHRIAFVYSK